MNFGQDFKKYATGHVGMSSLYVDDYVNNSLITTGSMTPYILEEREMRMTQMDIFSRLMKDRIIWLAGEVNDNMSTIVQAQLMYLNSVDPKKAITLHIDSPGGSVKSGLSMVDVMQYIDNDIHTINTGMAASMGSVLLGAGTKGKRSSLRFSRTMIHQPMTGFNSYAQASDMEIEAKEINSLKKELYEIISDNTGQAYDKVYKDGDRDYWMTAQDAKKYGMVDEIILKRK